VEIPNVVVLRPAAEIIAAIIVKPRLWPIKAGTTNRLIPEWRQFVTATMRNAVWIEAPGEEASNSNSQGKFSDGCFQQSRASNYAVPIDRGIELLKRAGWTPRN
jgi:hypothetical protein